MTVILEFDFIATGDSFSFNYSFGSEEYNEYVNGGVQRRFWSFPGWPGHQWTIRTMNPSTLPSTFQVQEEHLPVSINTVNLAHQSEFYIDNDERMLDPNDTQMDGFTVF